MRFAQACTMRIAIVFIISVMAWCQDDIVSREKSDPTTAENVRERLKEVVREAIDSGDPESVLPRKTGLEIERRIRDGDLEGSAERLHDLILNMKAPAKTKTRDLSFENPTSKAKLWATVIFPEDASDKKRYPLVIIIPGGLGFGSGAAKTPEGKIIVREGFVVGYFDPDGRGKSEGKEDWNGKNHQDGLYKFLKKASELEFVDKENVGVVSSSLGLAMAAGTLGRYAAELKVKYFIDNEGPTDRFYITKNDDQKFLKIFAGHTTDEEDWWAEREAVRSIKSIKCPYLRVQHVRDHVHGENKQHAIDIINAATGNAPWTRINENEPNKNYTKDAPPKWLPNAQGPQAQETLKYIKEMSNMK